MINTRAPDGAKKRKIALFSFSTYQSCALLEKSKKHIFRWEVYSVFQVESTETVPKFTKLLMDPCLRIYKLLLTFGILKSLNALRWPHGGLSGHFGRWSGIGQRNRTIVCKTWVVPSLVETIATILWYLQSQRQLVFVCAQIIETWCSNLTTWALL